MARGRVGWVSRLSELVPSFLGSTPGFSEYTPGFSDVVPGFSDVAPGFSGLVAEFYEAVFLQKVGLLGRKMADLGRFLMRPASFDSGLCFDDPNVRWGAPGYVLEPGDPGYVPPIPSVNEPKTKGKRMKHKVYYPKRQADQIVWLANFISKLAGYATALSLQPAQVTAAVADAG